MQHNTLEYDNRFSFCIKINKKLSLAGVAQWIECYVVNRGLTGFIPCQGTCLGCGPLSRVGACERQPYTDISFLL